MSSVRDDIADVLVIGAGIVGAAVAYRLAERGRSVLVVDQGRRAGEGSTGASSGIVRFHYESFENAALAWESHGAWLDWRSEVADLESPVPGYRPTGALLLAPRRSAFQNMTANLQRLGVPHEVLSSAALRRRQPALDPGRFGPPSRPDDDQFWQPARGSLVGLATDVGGYVPDPDQAAASYALAAARRGVRFCWRTRVQEVVVVEGRAAGVRTDSGVLMARAVLNAAGPGSSSINRGAGLDSSAMLRTRPLRVETHVVRAPAAFRNGLATCVLDPDLGIAFRPDGAHDLHLSSVEPACDPLHWTAEPFLADPRPRRPYFDLQVLRLARRLPSLAVATRLRGLSALYDVSPDWNPLLGETPLPGLLVACGTSGNSFKTAPALGRVVASLVEAHLDGRPAPTSIRLPRTGVTLDLAPYRPVRRLAGHSSVIA